MHLHGTHDVSASSTTQFIDDRAAVDYDARTDDEEQEDDDDMEAQVRQADRRDFDMPAIEAGHETRLQSAAPYRIPTQLLSTSRSGTQDVEMPLPPLPLQARSPTPERCERTPLFLPEDGLLDRMTPMYLDRASVAPSTDGELPGFAPFAVDTSAVSILSGYIYKQLKHIYG